MHLDISVRHWLSEPERAEAAVVDQELDSQSIARETGQKCLQTASLNWEAFSVSGAPRGARSPVVAKETLTKPALRRRWERQKLLRSGAQGLARALTA